MTVVEHLEDLRRVLIICFGAWAVGTAIAFIFNGWLLGVLLHPLTLTLAKNKHSIVQTAIFTAPTEGLTVPIKIASIAGLILALPVVLWQIWTFVSPALQPAERKFALPFVASSLLLFAAGAAFAYFVMPLGLNFLASFLNGNAVYFPDINQYLSFLLLLILIFGVTFELPIAIILLGLLRIVSSQKLRAHRKAIWVGIIFAALIVTPGADPFTPTALAIPLLILFEVSVLVLAKALNR